MSQRPVVWRFWLLVRGEGLPRGRRLSTVASLAAVAILGAVLLGTGSASAGPPPPCMPTGPTNTVAPSVTPTGTVGLQLLTGNQGSWSPVCVPISGYTYQWYRGSTAISGATALNYTTQAADVGSSVKLQVTACDTLNACNSADSNSVTVSCTPTNSVAPTMNHSGNGFIATQIGVSSNGTWSTPTGCGTNSFRYEWFSGSTLRGTASTYTTQSVDIGSTITLKVQAFNSHSSSAYKASSNSFVVVPAPTNSVAPSISGTTSVGQQLTGNDGTWNTYGLSSTTSRQWQLCGYKSTVMSDNPLDYWRLGDSSGVSPTAPDALQRDDGRFVGSPSFGAAGALNSDANTAAGFNGSTYADLAEPIPFGASNFTIEGWFKTSSAAANQQIWESDYSGTVAQPQDVFLGLEAGKMVFQVADQTGASAFVTSTSTYTNGAWHYVAAVRNGNTFTLYVDGASVGSTTQTIGNVDLSGSIPRIGDGQSANSNSHDTYYFGGSLDEIAVYGSALSSSRVSAHYNAGLNITNSCANISGATGQTYTLIGTDFGDKLRYGVSKSNTDGTSSVVYSSLTAAVTDSAPPTPTAKPVANGAAATTESPVLQATASDSDGDPVDFQFQVAKSSDPGFNSPLASSGWLTDTDTWTVPAGVLADGNYIFRSQARDPYQNTAWSTPQSFTIQLPLLGTTSYWPMWSHGPVAVNEANGNLVLSLPTPSYPTAVGSLTFSLTYNSQATTSSTGLGTGWTLAAGDAATSPPLQLVDHNQDTTPYPAIEIDWPDGSFDFYNQVGSSDTYLPDSDDQSQLTKNQDGSGWTLLASDGTTSTFGAESSGISRLTGAEQAATTSGNGTFSYSFDPTTHQLDSVTFHQQSGDSGETLTFNWSCSGALFCVTGPDGRTWTYSANASNQITTVNDPARQLFALTYNASGLPSEIQNADDLDPTHASPGYNGQHSLQLTYSGSKVSCVIDGPISGQTASAQPSCAGGGTASDSTWSFNYAPTCPSLRQPQPGHSIQQGTMAGCTTVTNPDQQPSGAGVTVIYDGYGRSLESDDARLGSGNERITLEQYNAQNQLAWSEDADGNPTDYTYDTLNNVLTSVSGPKPSSSQARPVTSYRYDEQTIGTTGQAGNPLTGLAGAYWTNTNLAGQPATRENDPSTSSSATTFSLPATGMTWPPSVVGAGAFSARWTGDINIPSTGDYTFTTLSDGSTRLTVDQNDLIENWTSPTSPSSSDPVHLTAGAHPLVLEYEHPSGSANLTLQWFCSDCSPAISNTAIPLSNLAPAWENQTSVVSPAGRISFKHYLNQASGQPDYSLTRLSDGTNLITSYVYDSLGRTTKQYMPQANASASLDSNTGNLTSTPDTDYETDYTYYTDYPATGSTATPPSDCGGGTAVDQYGQLEQTTIPNGGLHSVVNIYNSAGQPVATTDGKGTSCLSYDSENRLTSQTPNGDQNNPTTYTYDPNGTQLTTSNASGTVTDRYDEANRLIDTVDASGAEASYTYDPDGNQLQRTAATGPLGSSTNYTTADNYDGADELTSETDPANNTYQFFYDDRGNLRGTQYPNGTFSWVGTNPDGWITDQDNRHGTITASTTTPPSDSNPLADYTYTYDADGKQASQTLISGSNSQTTGYSYDNAGRLNQVVLPSGTCRDYGFNLDSDRTQIQESPSGCGGTFSTTASYTYDPTTTPGTDELTKVTAGSNTTTYGYTSDGQVSSQGTTSFTWDGFGRLSTATVGTNTVTYTYDPNGAVMNRVSSSPSTTTNYLLGDLFETNSAGTITTSHTDGPAGDLASFNGPPSGTSTISYLYYDAHGNLAAEASSPGTLTSSHTYDPFGSPLDSVPANTTVHRFVGRWNKQYDTTTGDILMGARPYDPTTGRFLSVDPVPGGSLNNYDYADQDPVNDYDLNGESACSKHGWLQWSGFCQTAKITTHGVHAIGHAFVVANRWAGRHTRTIWNVVRAGGFLYACWEGAAVGSVGGLGGAVAGCIIVGVAFDISAEHAKKRIEHIRR